MSREDVALEAPSDTVDLAEFPVAIVGPTMVLYRAHRHALGPWYFSSSGTGRFDLTGDRGTCYLAVDAVTAIREVLGSTLHQLGFVPAEFARLRCVSHLRLPIDHTLADLCSPAAATYGLTREIHTLVPYTVPQAWAARLAEIGDGLLYQSRFTTVAAANAVAVFGWAGACPWPQDEEPTPFAVAARAAGMTVAEPPTAVTIVPPPGAP